MNKPLITVAIPHYHRTHEESIFFENCLKSVMQQTIYDKCQVLLVDDCSPLQDALEHIVHQSGIKIMTYRQPINKGLANARNKLLEMASGEYIYFLDSDDCLYKDDSLETLYNKIIEKDSDVVIGQYYEELLDADGKPYHIVKSGDRTPIHGKLYKTSYLKTNGIEFLKDARIHEDIYFNLQVFYSLNTKIAVLDTPVMIWKYRKNSIVRENGCAYSFNSHLTYMRNALLGIKVTKNLINPSAILISILTHGYVAAQACEEFNKLDNKKDIEDYMKRFIKANKRLLEFISYDVIASNIGKQIITSSSKFGPLLMKESAYTWFKKLGWKIEKERIFTLNLLE